MNNIEHKVVETQDVVLWSLEEVKNYLRVAHDNDDNLVRNLLKAAIINAEQFLGTSIFKRKITCVVQRAPDYVDLKYQPVFEIANVAIVQEEDRQDITDNFGYFFKDAQRVSINNRYKNRKLEISYEAGWGENTPSAISHGILMQIGRMYDFGENSNVLTKEIYDFYLPYRVLKI